MMIGDELKRAMLKIQVYSDEHKKSRTHQRVLMDVCHMLNPLCEGILDINFTEVLLFGRDTTEDERTKLKELWYGKEKK